MMFPIAWRVITLGPERLRLACLQLAHVISKNEFRPDLIVGIASGGVLIADELARHVSDATASRCDVTARRPMSALKKNKPTSGLLSRLPRPLSNLLRIVENALGQVLSRRKALPLMHATDAAVDLVRGACQILVVDDAVDSGLTLSAVLQGLHAVNAKAQIRSAALVVTRPNAVTQPDFSLYRHCLIRFPWSSDYSAGKSGT